jgi:sugar lactone lactonase YvrE
MLYRDIPAELKGREMVVFMHRDVVPGGVAQDRSAPTVALAPEATLGEGQIGNARGITVDSQGNLYAADFANHRVVVLDAAGNLVRTVGNFGSGAGQLHEPSGVALDAAGNLYVADTWNARVSKFAPDGTFIKSWGSGTTAYGSAIADPATGAQVQKVATDTKGEAAANAANPLGFFGPRNVLVANDRVYITDTGNARIVVTDLEGHFVQQWGTKGSAATQLQEPIGLGVDEAGRIYVGDTWNARVQVFEATNGEVDPNPVATLPVRGWAPNTYNDPYIAVAGDGRVWASQGARNTIAEYDAAGQYVRRLRGDPALARPKGMAVGSDGALYAVNNGQHVLRFRP